jgi:hypothetical protein
LSNRLNLFRWTITVQNNIVLLDVTLFAFRV